ncbi:CbtA family protein [Fulvimarina sp. 2208YS6-2-32]|uniref:CbtA family protein n=1 Tax=Fulvimarina uroteuthidis TaxID=3098149 RepID=A0ABU5I4I5_9HYPH|nr:CbtA family protein [Fulvimarina sp. 2208YS6-2-32]MDY8110293.1 CbtA family protein [Fulvimarina sp. 2208YS6-2-32]
MFKQIIAGAILAGAGAGLCASLLQIVFVQPVLLHAELYESGQLVHFGSASDVSADQAVAGFDLQRDSLTTAFNLLVYTGYALILTALMALAQLRGATISARNGLVWGACGFFVVQFAPGFSLAPEVPGVAVVDVQTRQLWWTMTVAAAGIAVWLAAFGRSPAAWGAAIVLLLLPHIVGAPEPEFFAGPAPTELGALFVSRAYGVSLAAWTALGILSAFFLRLDPARERTGVAA